MLSKKRRKAILLPLIMLSLVCSVLSFNGLNSILIGSTASAQITNSNPIQILSTSTNTDDLGNFHIIGEVNNTSTQPQTSIAITALLSNTTNGSKVLVGNHSAFSSIGTLRTGELSPFDIIIQNPQQILGKFNFMEFSATSQPAITDKPSTLVLNGSSSFVDNVGNPHISGNIINQGQSPEQFLNLVATFYDNSSLGVVGTQSIGLEVGNLPHNQMVPFDITITDNKTKSQGAFYSLNVESSQSSMNLPLNTKTSFVATVGFTSSSEGDLANISPINNPPVFVNNNDDESSTRNNDDDGDDGDDGDDQRGEKKTDDEGNPWFNDRNCNEKSGSSGGSSSECEEAEKEEESDVDDEDSSEKDQGPSSNSDSSSTNDDNGTGEDNGEDSNVDNNTESDENNDDDGNDNVENDTNEGSDD